MAITRKTLKANTVNKASNVDAKPNRKPVRPAAAPKAERKPKTGKTKIEKATAEFNLPNDSAKDFGRVMIAVLTEITNGVSATDIIERLTAQTGGKAAGDKKPRTPKESKTGPIGMFEKATRAFGYLLRKDHDTAELKAAFKESLAKHSDSGVQLSHFNKVFDGQFIVAGLVKRKGVLTFTGYDSNGKRASAPVPAELAK